MSSAPQGGNGRFWRTTLLALIGPLVWAAHFALVYGAHHVLCRVGAQGGTAFWLITAASVLAIAILATLVVSPGLLKHLFNASGRTPQMLNFLVSITRVLIILSLAGIAWAATALVFLPVCPSVGQL